MRSVSIMVESIGKKLAQARLARGLTLEEAAMETRIRAKQLAALEADDYSSFANNTYARGFLLMYGKFLNVDVRAFARELEAGGITFEGRPIPVSLLPTVLSGVELDWVAHEARAVREGPLRGNAGNVPTEL